MSDAGEKKSAGLPHPFLYEWDASTGQSLHYQEFVLPPRIHDVIREAQNIADSKSMKTTGLGPILSWAAPEVDLFSVKVIEGVRTLRLILVEAEPANEGVKLRVGRALELWISLTLPAEKRVLTIEALRNALAKPQQGIGWNERMPLSLELVPDKDCAVPFNYFTFDVIALHAAKQLEGKLLNDKNAGEGRLISTEPRKSVFHGQSLIRFEPTLLDTSRQGQPCWFTEVFTVSATSTPEQKAVRVAVNVGTRHYGDITRSSFDPGRDRHVDIFLRPSTLLSGKSGRVRCFEFPIAWADLNRVDGKRTWKGKQAALLSQMLQLESVDLGDLPLGLSPLVTTNVHVLPRLGSIHSDNLFAGTGVSAVERRSYLDFLDEQLGVAGFNRVQVERVRARPKSGAQIEWKAEKLVSVEDRRAALVEAAMQNGSKPHVSFGLLSASADGLPLMREAMGRWLGEPLKVEGDQLTYPDGLLIELKSVPAGPFAEVVDAVDEATIPKVDVKKREAIRKKKVRDIRDRYTAKLETYLRTQVGLTAGTRAILVEMSDQLVDAGDRDPYQLNYQAAARQGTVVQTRLVSAEEADPEALKAVFDKCFLDLLRMLGTSAIKPDSTRMAAWWVIHRSDPDFITPVYMEFDRGRLSAALLDESLQVMRVSHPKAIGLIAMQKVCNVGKEPTDSRQRIIERFFADATPSDNQPTILFVDSSNLRPFVPGVGNGELSLGRLALGAAGATAPSRIIQDNSAISVVRLAHDPGKAPCYWVDHVDHGLTTGVFREPGAKRTFLISRGLPVALDKDLRGRQARTTSRFDEEAKGRIRYKDRKFPSLTEICILVRGDGISELALAGAARKLMNAHLTTTGKDSTLLPFPLHEASRL
ncbi:MAG: RNaseH domain-containing protein [Burkholderiales bacterium]|nr:RNaseH domain-containing protein [Burkholderiales bacterium]